MIWNQHLRINSHIAACWGYAALITIGTFNSMVRLIASSRGVSIGAELLVLVVTALIPWVHYLYPSGIGAKVMKLLSVVQGVVSAVQLFLVFEPEFQFSTGPAKWLLFFGAEILSLVIHSLMFRASSVHVEESGSGEDRRMARRLRRGQMKNGRPWAAVGGIDVPSCAGAHQALVLIRVCTDFTEMLTVVSLATSVPPWPSVLPSKLPAPSSPSCLPPLTLLMKSPSAFCTSS